MPLNNTRVQNSPDITIIGSVIESAIVSIVVSVMGGVVMRSMTAHSQMWDLQCRAARAAENLLECSQFIIAFQVLHHRSKENVGVLSRPYLPQR